MHGKGWLGGAVIVAGATACGPATTGAGVTIGLEGFCKYSGTAHCGWLTWWGSGSKARDDLEGLVLTIQNESDAALELSGRSLDALCFDYEWLDGDDWRAIPVEWCGNALQQGREVYLAAGRSLRVQVPVPWDVLDFTSGRPLDVREFRVGVSSRRGEHDDWSPSWSPAIRLK